MIPWEFGVPMLSMVALISFGLGAFHGHLWHWRKGYDTAKKAMAQAHLHDIEHLDGRCENYRREIEGLKAQLEEARAMARKPLTEAQLKACLDKNGDECPRCGNEAPSELSYEDFEYDDDDQPMQRVECDDCGEKWMLRYKIIKVEPVED